MNLIRQFFKLIWYFSLLIQILLVVAYFRFYRSWDEPSIQVPQKLDKAIQETVGKVPGQLPRPEIAQRPLLVLPLVNDREKLLTTALRKAIDDDGQFRTVDQSTLDRILTKLGIQEENVTDSVEAIKLGKAAEAEVVLIGRVVTMKMQESQSLVEFTAQAYQVSDGASLFEKTRFTNAPPEPVDKPAKAGGKSLDLWFLLGLACFALLWPILLVPLIRKVLDQEHNGLTAVTLLAVIAVPVAVSWFVILGDSVGLLRFALLILISIAVALWCAFVMNQIAADHGS